MHGAAWTDERIDLLKRLWSDGETATTIAARLGSISRSAVLGKIFRLRLGAADAGKAKKARAKPMAKSRHGKSPRAARHTAPPRRRRRVKKKNPPKDQRPAPSSARKTLFELTNDCCRWPYGRAGAKNFLFCGAAGADLGRGLPYCARHMRRAYFIPPAIVVKAQRVAAQAA